MISTVWFLVILALVDSANPVVMGMLLLVVSKKMHRFYELSFITGVFASSFIGGVMLVFGLGSFLDWFLAGEGNEGGGSERWTRWLSAGLRLALGAACIALGLRMANRFRANGWGQHSAEINAICTEEAVSAQVRFKPMISLLLLGGMTNSTDLITVTPFIAAVDELIRSELGTSMTLLLLCLYNGVLIAPMLLLWFVFRKRDQADVTNPSGVQARLQSMVPVMAKWAAVFIGMALICSGVWLLVFT